MKRNMLIIVALVALLLPNIAGASEGEFRVFINGQQFPIARDLGKPFIDDQSRTQVPIRAVSEGLGHGVEWNSLTKTVTINKSETDDIFITIGSKKVISSGDTIIMDTAAVIREGRTYVPLRFVSEALGYDVHYRWKGYHSISIVDAAVKPVFCRSDYRNLPGEIENWIEFSKKLPLVQEKEYSGKRYVLITEGMKPTGGYSLEVEDVVVREDKLVIKVKSTKPGKYDMVTQAITYPYDLIVVENKELPLEVIDVNDEDRYFMRLLGIDAIDRPVVAGSDWIKVFEPSPDKKVAGTFKLAGIASVFEGTVSYELVNRAGEVLLSGFTTAAMGDWAYFEEVIKIPGVMDDNELFLKLYSESAKDGSKMFEVTIPLRVQPSM